MGRIKLLYLVFVVSLSTVNAHAYIDPGTGAFIVQTLIAVGATIVFYLGWPIRFLKSLFSKKRKKSNGIVIIIILILSNFQKTFLETELL